MRLLYQRERYPVGIDIRCNEIRIVQLERKKSGAPRLICAEIAQSDIPTFSHQTAMDWAALRSLMGEMVKRNKLEGQSAVIGLPSSGVKMMRMLLPVGLQPYAIEAAIQARLRQEMPEIADAICLDYALLKKTTPDQQEVYVVVARQEFLAQYVDCAVSAGLEVKIVDVDIFAIHRMLTFTDSLIASQHSIDAIVVCSQSLIQFIVYDDSVIIFHQEDEFNDDTAAIALFESYLRHFYSDYSQFSISKLYLNVGNALSEEMSAIVAGSAAVIVKVDIANLFSALPETHLYLPALQDTLLVACGLAMREIPAWC